MGKQNILILANKNDLKRNFLSKNLLGCILNQFKNENLKVFSRYREVRSKVDKKLLLDSSDLNTALSNFKKDIDKFILITKLAISNIDYDKLELYHSNHDKKCTIVLRNLVKGKTTPVYRLDKRKMVVGVNKKRYANCGVYAFDSNVQFENINTLSSLLNNLIEKNQVKSFIHTGYYQRDPNKKIKGISYKKRF